jgi:hypothetical protein
LDRSGVTFEARDDMLVSQEDFIDKVALPARQQGLGAQPQSGHVHIVLHNVVERELIVLNV